MTLVLDHRRGNSAPEGQRQEGGGSGGTGRRLSCKWSLLENREALKSLLRRSGSEAEQAPREGIPGGVEGPGWSWWPGVWGWSNLPSSVSFLGYHPTSREPMWRRQMRLWRWDLQGVKEEGIRNYRLESAGKGMVEGTWVQPFLRMWRGQEEMKMWVLLKMCVSSGLHPWWQNQEIQKHARMAVSSRKSHFGRYRKSPWLERTVLQRYWEFDRQFQKSQRKS